MHCYKVQKETKSVKVSEINNYWLSYERINHFLLEVFVCFWGFHYVHRIFNCSIISFGRHLVAFIVLGEKQTCFIRNIPTLCRVTLEEKLKGTDPSHGGVDHHNLKSYDYCPGAWDMDCCTDNDIYNECLETVITMRKAMTSTIPVLCYETVVQFIWIMLYLSYVDSFYFLIVSKFCIFILYIWACKLVVIIQFLIIQYTK